MKKEMEGNAQIWNMWKKMDIDVDKMKTTNAKENKDEDSQESENEDSEAEEDENLEEAQKDHDRRADITIGSTTDGLT